MTDAMFETCQTNETIRPSPLVMKAQRNNVIFASCIGSVPAGLAVWFCADIAIKTRSGTEETAVLLGICFGILCIVLGPAWLWWMKLHSVSEISAGVIHVNRLLRNRHIAIDDIKAVMRWSFVNVPVYSIQKKGHFFGSWVYGYGLTWNQLEQSLSDKGIRIRDRI